MKIERLYTLSQFVDRLDNYENGINMNSIECFSLSVEYNDLLKQPLTKDMFVCEVEKPHISMYEQPDGTDDVFLFSDDYLKWHEAQNKVIFDGMKPVSRGNQFAYDSGDNGAFKVICPNDYKTLHDLAEATNGQLKLKNVEL